MIGVMERGRGDVTASAVLAGKRGDPSSILIIYVGHRAWVVHASSAGAGEANAGRLLGLGGQQAWPFQ